MTRRRWIADTWNEATAALHGDQAQHLSRVLRAQPGMEFDVVAGGQAWLARIASIDRGSVHFTLLHELDAAAALPVTLLLSIFKFDRMEWAIEKAVELGSSRIVPVLSERTEKHLAQAAAKRTDRWRRLALGSGQAIPPQRSSGDRRTCPVSGNSCQDNRWRAGKNREPKGSHFPVRSASCSRRRKRISRCYAYFRERKREGRTGGIALAVGPEGGWTAGEIAAFRTRRMAQRESRTTHSEGGNRHDRRAGHRERVRGHGPVNRAGRPIGTGGPSSRYGLA